MQPPYGLAVAISDRQDGSFEQQEVSGRDVVASAKIIAVQRKRWIRRRWSGRRRVAGDDETTTEKLEEAGRKVWLMPDQEGSLLLVLRLCQARPRRDDDDRHLPGH